MKTKIGLPFGLALVMFIGIFTTMLALGVLNPDRAEAAATDTVELTLSESVATATPQTVMVEFTNGEAEIAAGETITIDLTSIDGSDGAVSVESNWKVYVGDGEAFEPATVVGNTGSVVITLPNDDDTTDEDEGRNVPIEAAVKIVFTSDDSGSAPAGFVLGAADAAAMVTINNFDSNDYTLTDGSGSVKNLRVTSSSMTPGGRASHTFRFQVSGELIANQDEISLYFDKDFGGLDELSRDDVTVSRSNVNGHNATGAFNPSSDLDRESLTGTKHGIPAKDSLNNIEYTFRVPDMNGDADDVANIDANSVVTVVVSSGAGITMPTEAGSKGPIGAFTNKQLTLVQRKVPVNLAIALSSYASNRGKSLTIIGKGFKNDTTASVYVSSDDGSETSLGDVLVGSDDTFTHTVTVTVPPFVPGADNMIYASDGKADPNESPKLGFEVEGLAVLSPVSAAVGDEVDITLEDWPSLLGPTVTIAGVGQTIISGTGTANLRVKIGTDTPSGTSQLVVETDGITDSDGDVTTPGEKDTVNITISGADLSADVTTVVPNQVITLTGHGFTGRGKISTGADDDISEIKVGNSASQLDSGTRNFNGGQEVTISSGGTWSASLIIPITTATTSAGTHTVEVKDDGNRSGSFEITIPERTLSIEPVEARPGEWVTLTGSGFPSDNSRSKQQSTPSVSIMYDGNDVGTARPDSSGDIVLRFVVPRDATIPSTNRVEAEYLYEGGGTTPVRTSTNHEVPGARITLATSEGSPGDTLTVTGDGFKSFTSIDYVKIGGIDVTPAPKPATNRDGEFTATILVPDLAPGANSVEISVGSGTESGATANANFKVLEESATPTTMMMEAEAATPEVAFAAVIAEDNLIAVYHFDPATQNEAPNYGYTVYDARPLFMSGNNLDSIEPGQFYTVQVSEDQMGVTLGSQTVDLYAPFTPIRW